MVVHIFLQKKVRSGKTFISWLFAQFKNDHGEPCRVIDLDPHQGISDFKALHSIRISNRQVDEEQKVIFSMQPLVELFNISKSDLIIDTNSQSFDVILQYFRKKDIFEMYEEKGVRFIFHLPVSGSEYVRGECVAAINELLTTVPNANVVIWLNHFPAPLFDTDTPPAEFFFNMFSDEGKIQHIVNLPQISKGDTVTRDNDFFLLKNILKEKRIFSEILDPEKFKYAEDPQLNGVPVFMLVDYQISFLRDEFERAMSPLAEIVF